ncbi:alpha-ketoglutarate-dependent dioxygenase alkB homolog 3 isoform 3-T5 [Morphnus guianensis]
MTERRQRARVQGGWAGAPAGRLSAPKVAVASNLAPAAARPAWMRKDQPHTQKQFVFEKPSEVERKVPETGVIDKPGVYELSKVPSGIARIHLIPGFIDSEQADWMFEQLLQDIPWGQRTHVRHEVSFEEPRLTSWYGELPYTYSRITMQPNPNEENGDYTYVERLRIPLDHGTLLMMEGATQEDWQHRVPKEYHSRDARINLTFRIIYPEPDGVWK